MKQENKDMDHEKPLMKILYSVNKIVRNVIVVIFFELNFRFFNIK